ncbi:intercellular trafficking and secretion [Malassezia japonica]|uniref:Sorting nexin-4 n=1 Tax=Malassezia japonica TaxID=223818 RepID=A0AAF0F898_9BASI|nr:intercellular trafficking and secretion [Malassezia japonica]WFD40238.1 intercellular trafficking and secretion [Malassezia japonica]
MAASAGPLEWHGALQVQIFDPRTETPGAPSESGSQAGRSETFVSYGVRAESSLPHFARGYMVTRKRFQDFAFLHDALAKEFPACIIPPLPEKRRIGYVIGDRFSEAFIQRRAGELQLFLERICRHPTLQRATILQQFLESNEWHIDMHTHSGRPVASEDGVHQAAQHSLVEQMSDTILNAFAKVRKPDPRFLAVKAELEQNEESVSQLRRVLLRNRTHVSDYTDFATSLEQLAILESGMAGTLTEAAKALHAYGDLQTKYTTQCTDVVLGQLQSQLAYAHAHAAPLKLRESKQLDFEGLTDYLAHEVTERDRLVALGGPRGAEAAGNVRGTGLRGYLRSTVDKVWGVDEEQARIERLQRLDGRIEELNEAVQTAHDQALALNTHVAQEHHVYTLGRRREQKQTLAAYVDGNIALYSQGVSIFDKLIASLEKEAV